MSTDIFKIKSVGGVEEKAVNALRDVARIAEYLNVEPHSMSIKHSTVKGRSEAGSRSI